MKLRAVSLAALLPLAAVCVTCGGRPGTGVAHPSAAPATDIAAYLEHPLRWVPGSATVIADSEWTFDADRGAFDRAECSRTRSASCRDGTSYSSDGARFALADGAALVLGGASGVPDAPEALPSWIGATSGAGGDVVSVAFWSGPRTVVVHQFSTADPTQLACRARDVSTHDWTVPKSCPDGDFSYLYRVDGGPLNLVALHSESEGHSAIGVARYSPESGQSAKLVTLVQEGGGSVEVTFAIDGSRVDFVSPCALDPANPMPCTDPELATKWRLYTLSTTDGRFALERDDLPPGSAYDSKRRRFAWPRGNDLCVGDPREARPRCVKLPR